MTEWKEYTGSDEQIAEMRETTNGFILRYSTGVQTEIFKRIGSSYVGEYIDSRRRLLSGNNLKEVLTKNKITHYLICNPHPLADMICQQAKTGQPVWVKTSDWTIDVSEYGGELTGQGTSDYMIFVTSKPDWNLTAEYSFSSFEKEIEFKEDL